MILLTYEKKTNSCNSRKTECRKIYADESFDRTEDRNHIEQTADDQKPHPDGLYGYGTWADRISGYTGDPQGQK